mmetsp:Transcript_3590/g.12109  ORF Transcript_3590/g.12109 Transcript_3590/m.12109 type:complete len:227 (+) Transcript_3590:59-739(+)
MDCVVVGSCVHAIDEDVDASSLRARAANQARSFLENARAASDQTRSAPPAGARSTAMASAAGGRNAQVFAPTRSMSQRVGKYSDGGEVGAEDAAVAWVHASVTRRSVSDLLASTPPSSRPRAVPRTTLTSPRALTNITPVATVFVNIAYVAHAQSSFTLELSSSPSANTALAPPSTSSPIAFSRPFAPFNRLPSSGANIHAMQSPTPIVSLRSSAPLAITLADAAA